MIKRCRVTGSAPKGAEGPWSAIAAYKRSQISDMGSCVGSPSRGNGQNDTFGAAPCQPCVVATILTSEPEKEIKGRIVPRSWLGPRGWYMLFVRASCGKSPKI